MCIFYLRPKRDKNVMKDLLSARYVIKLLFDDFISSRIVFEIFNNDFMPFRAFVKFLWQFMGKMLVGMAENV